mgnify:FL=1
MSSHSVGARFPKLRKCRDCGRIRQRVSGGCGVMIIVDNKKIKCKGMMQVLRTKRCEACCGTGGLYDLALGIDDECPECEGLGEVIL